MNKSRVVFTCLLLAVLLAAGCAVKATPEATKAAETVKGPKTYKFAISLPTKSSQWWTVYANMLVSTIDAINAKGEYKIEYTLIHNEAPTDQVESVQTQIINEPDIVLMAPLDLDTSVSAVDAAHAAGIPVVTCCRESKSKNVTAARVYNEPQFAINQLEAINKDFPEGAQIVYLFGPNTASYAQIQYNQGLLANLPKYPKLKLLEVFEDKQDTQDIGVKLADDALLKYGEEIDAFAATNDGLALGAVQALKAAGYEGKIKVYGSSALPQGMVAIRDGFMSFTNMKSQAVMAEAAIKLCLDVLEGKTFEKYGLIDPVAINKDNVLTIRDATFGGTIADPATFNFSAY